MLRKVVWIGIVVVFIRGLVFGQGVPYGVEFQVNTYTEDWQENPCITSLPDGGFVVCWVSHSQDDSRHEIYGQIFSSTGEKVGNEFQVNTYTEGQQESPCITSLPDGGFVVCWVSRVQYGREQEVYGQIFSATGEKVGEEFQVNTYTTGFQGEPCITSLSDGRFVVCWDSWHQDGSEFGIYGQIFSSIGEKVGNEFWVNMYTKLDQKDPCITLLSDGGFVVCWESGHQDGSGYGIYGQIFSSIGEKIGNEFQVNMYTEDDQIGPCITSLSDGGFVVCWGSYWEDGSGNGVYGQIFSSTGEKVGEEFQVNTYTEGWQSGPCITSLSDGGFVVCWESGHQDGSGYGIYGQCFSSTGEKIGKEFQVNTYTEGDQRLPCIASLDDGSFVVCWTSYEQDGSGSGIYAKRFPASPLVHALKPFRLLEPFNDSSLRTNYITLRWQQTTEELLCYPWEIQYEIYIDDTPDFTSPEIYEQDMDTTFLLQNLQPGRTYFWKVLAQNVAGDSVWSSDVFGFYVRPDVGVKEEFSQETKEFSLDQNYPNPFNASTEIRYELPVSGHVTVAIYDINGRLVRVLVQGVEEAGCHSIVWDGKDESGKDVPSGIYVYVLRFEDKENLGMVLSRKMGLVR